MDQDPALPLAQGPQPAQASQPAQATSGQPSETAEQTERRQRAELKTWLANPQVQAWTPTVISHPKPRTEAQFPWPPVIVMARKLPQLGGSPLEYEAEAEVMVTLHIPGVREPGKIPEGNCAHDRPGSNAWHIYGDGLNNPARPRNEADFARLRGNETVYDSINVYFEFDGAARSDQMGVNNPYVRIHRAEGIYYVEVTVKAMRDGQEVLKRVVRSRVFQAVDERIERDFDSITGMFTLFFFFWILLFTCY